MRKAPVGIFLTLVLLVSCLRVAVAQSDSVPVGSWDSAAVLQGWHLSDPQNVLFDGQNTGQPELKVTAAGPSAGGIHGAQTDLPLDQIRGTMLNVYVEVKATGVTMPVHSYNGIKVMVHITSPSSRDGWAQAPAKTAPVAPALSPVQAPAPAAPAEPTPSHLAAARELLELNGIARSFTSSIPQFFDQVGSTLTQTRPELASDLSQVFGQLKPEFDKKADDLTDRAAHLYAKLLSEQDLKAIDAFFKSDAGKKYVQTQPDFMKDVVVIMESWREQISTDMMTRVRMEMQKKGHEL